MAQRIIHMVLDDLTGEEGAETATFEVNGQRYEIDLKGGAAPITEALEPFIKAGRRVSGARRAATSKGSNGTAAPATSKGGTDDADEKTKAREWAVKNGIDVPKRGRLPQRIFDAYKADNPDLALPSAADA